MWQRRYLYTLMCQFFRVKWPAINGALSYLLERITADGEHLAEYFGPETQADLDMASPGVGASCCSTDIDGRFGSRTECVYGRTTLWHRVTGVE